MGIVIALLLIAAAAFAAYRLFRHKQLADLALDTPVVLECTVTFMDRERTSQWMEAYFREAHIGMLLSYRYVESGENIDLNTNIYRLRLPNTLGAAELVSHLSGHETVLSVSTKPV